MKSISEKFLNRRVFTRGIQSFLPLLFILSLTSCSWISSKRSLFGDETVESAQEKRSEKLQSVPKEQYEQLQRKYNELLAKSKSTPVPVEQQAPQLSSEEIVNQLSQAKESSDLVETVDVFSGEPIAKKVNSIDSRATVAPVVVPPSEIEAQIISLERARALSSQNKFDQSLTILKELEKSNVRQIKVRAKFEIGELLFIQGEFDLAMQVFEEIIHREAFSGVVLKVLGRLIVCSEKLKLSKKKQKYYSILHDFFEQA
ncbi:tetratricopeptide repeat protein [Halobacteriovorax marinus]|uniref:tetratricopeptide repeat protein n=1 Tax=Halobacteriovorax marinus TaxID=97084 RepID=UPI003A92657B